MKQMKILGVVALALTLGLTACGGGGGGSKSSKHTHKWGDWTVVTPATCTEAGTQERSCECGEKQTKEIPAAHTWGEWETVTAATCQAEGSKKRTCTVCHQEETGVIDKVDHTWGEWETVTAADCDNAGSRKHTCSVCGEEATETVPATGHTWGEWVTVTEATCEGKGSRKHTCSVCNKEESEEVAALGHDLELVGGETQAPEGEATVRLYKCKRCNIQYLGFKADEPSAASKPHLMEGDNGGMRFFGRPIGNALALDATGKSVNEQNNECVYCSTETGDFFEYIFTLNAEQAATLATCRLYCDARPADHLSGDFWAYGRSATDWTPGYYIDGADEHVQKNEDGTDMMVYDHARSVKNEDGSEAEGVQLETQVKMGARIEDFRYVLYVDDVIQELDADTPVPAEGSQTNMVRKEYVLPFTFHLHAGQNKISLRMAGGYRSEFYNFVFRPYVEPTPITVNETAIEVREGKTAQITSSMEGLTYSSANNSIASVDSTGLVTGVKAGTTTITVSKEGNYKEAKVPVTVLEKEGIITLNLEDGVRAPETDIERYSSSSSGVWFRNFKKDATLTYTFQSEKAGKFDIQLGLRGSNIVLADNFEIKVNDAAVALEGTVNTSYSAVDYIVGQADLKVGENTMVIKALADNEMYLKTLKLIPHVYVAFQTYSIEDLEANRTDSGWDATKDFGGEKAFKFNKAGSVTVSYTAEAAGKAMLQLKIGVKFSNKDKTGFWKQDGADKTKITINGVALAAGAEPDFSNVKDSGVSDSGNISVPEWFNIAEIDLIAGANSIQVEFIKGGYSYYLGGIALAK